MARTAAPPRTGDDEENRKLNVVLRSTDYSTLHDFAKRRGVPLTVALRDIISLFGQIDDMLGDNGEVLIRGPEEGQMTRILMPR